MSKKNSKPAPSTMLPVAGSTWYHNATNEAFTVLGVTSIREKSVLHPGEMFFATHRSTLGDMGVDQSGRQVVVTVTPEGFLRGYTYEDLTGHSADSSHLNRWVIYIDMTGTRLARLPEDFLESFMR